MGTAGIALIMLFAIALGMGGAIVAISAFIGRRRPPAERLLPYECGLDPADKPRHRFSVKYFLVAVLFIIFDVEVVFFYPWALAFRDAISAGKGMFLMIEMAVFMCIIVIALAYAWGRGALDWED